LDTLSLCLYVDGASLGNPGKAGIAFILSVCGKKPLRKMAKFIGYTTNNVAEYMGLIYGMQEALSLNGKKLVCFSDSELLINQIKGRYKVRNKNLMLFYNQVKHLESLFEKVEYHHIPREKNREADFLAKKAAREMREWVTAGEEKSPEESPGT